MQLNLLTHYLLKYSSQSNGNSPRTSDGFTGPHKHLNRSNSYCSVCISGPQYSSDILASFIQNQMITLIGIYQVLELLTLINNKLYLFINYLLRIHFFRPIK